MDPLAEYTPSFVKSMNNTSVAQHSFLLRILMGILDSNGVSYAEHFLGPFLDALAEIGVFPEVIMNHETYASGQFAEKIDSAIEQADEIREIIESISGEN